ncbi:MAG TPA: alpha-glucosidase C-terminal domain-containing protein [Acidimicrobiales bacterium]|nr:alpha-glucosidase C-terminal domain-containing protein [Acidimicrobiales bacterium]
MLVERRSLPVLGVGAFEVLACPNPSVLAYVRSGEVVELAPGHDEAFGPSVVLPAERRPGIGPVEATRLVPAAGAPAGGTRRTQAVLCVHNLSRFAQPAELQLARWAGTTPLEVLGRVPFPVIGEEPSMVTLGPYGYLWFELTRETPLAEEILG